MKNRTQNILIAVLGFVALIMVTLFFTKDNIKINVSVAGNPTAGNATSAVTTAATVAQTQATTVAAATDTTATQTATQETTASQTETQAPDTQAQTETTSAAQTQPQTTAPSSNGMSVEEIVALYNKSANKVKSSAKQINRNYSHLSIPEETLELPSAIQGIGKTAINTFVKPDDTVQEWTTADDFKLGFPVGDEDYTSHLTADMVQSATCTEEGNSYKLEIVLKDDAITNPAKGEGYAGVFNTTSASTFEGINVPGVTFNEVKINGINGSISATIEKGSENLTELTTRNTDVMYLDVKVAFSQLTAKMNMVQEANYVVSY